MPGPLEIKEVITQLSNDIKQASDEIKGLIDVQADEIKTHGATLGDTAKRLQKAEENYDKIMKDFADVQAEMKELQAKGQRPGYEENEAKSIGERFVNSEIYKSALTSGAKSTGAFDVKSFFVKADGGLSTSGVAGLNAPLRLGLIGPQQNGLLRLRDLMNVQRTANGSVEYIQELDYTIGAGPVAEGEIKPKSTLTFEQKSAVVKTIAHWIPATRQVLDDVAQLRNYIDNRLIYGLKEVEEEQILYGSGTGENLEGLMVAQNVQDAGGMGSKNMIEHIRHALTLGRLGGYSATGIVLNPVDWETIEMTKGTDGHYVFVSVTQGAETRLFRVPVVEAVAMKQGEFLTGAFGLATQLLDREQANVRISESHADYFIRNMSAILAEERIAMPIYRPQALVKGTFGAEAPATFQAPKKVAK